MTLYLLQALVFLASFLIFQIELILGKILLPSFGGGHLVWGISLVFYQSLLFLGYFYVHLARGLFSFKRFQKLQTGLIAGSLLLLPIDIEPLRQPSYSLPVVAEIVLLLLFTIGLFFFILSSLSVYAQVHIQNSSQREKTNPYLLYAGSNLGAFFGLLTYPFLVEPNWDIDQQLFAWQCLYGLLVLLFFTLQWRVPLEGGDRRVPVKFTAPGSRVLASWLMLSAAGTAMFLAITTELMLKIPPVPFVWVVPLTIYLLSFVLVFKNNPFCPRYIRDRWVLLTTLAVVLFMCGKVGISLSTFFSVMNSGSGSSSSLLWLLLEPAIWIAVCAVFCLVVHFHLAQARPAAPEQMTTYYLVLSLGGFLGGALVNWVAPLLFNESVEIIVALLLASLGLSLASPARPPYISKATLAFLLLLAGAPFLSHILAIENPLFIATGLSLATFILFFWMREKYGQIALTLAGIVLLMPFWGETAKGGTVLFKKRSYYGTYEVIDQDGFRKLMHGLILHGAQPLAPERKTQPITYYHPGSPLGGFLSENPLGFSNIGVLGLGTGSLAVFAGPGDHYDFFEIDPLVGEIAEKQFSYLSDSQGNIRLIFGDARISLRQMEDQKYDALVVDVFNGDTVPVHLLTREAIGEYRQRLRPEGILFFHISNQYLNLLPVITAAAKHLGLYPLTKFSLESEPPEKELTIWMALTADDNTAAVMTKALGWREVPGEDFPLWTDRYSSIFSVMGL